MDCASLQFYWCASDKNWTAIRICKQGSSAAPGGLMLRAPAQPPLDEMGSNTAATCSSKIPPVARPMAAMVVATKRQWEARGHYAHTGESLALHKRAHRRAT